MIYYLTYAVLSVVIFVNGWTDAPNAIASCVGSRSMKPASAVLLAAACNLLGGVTVIFTGGSVAESVYSIAGFGEGRAGLTALFAGLLSVAFWATLAWYFGIPTSESHALLAGISGAAVASSGFAALNVNEWGRVAIGLVISTLPAFLLAQASFSLIAWLCRKRRREDVTSFFVGTQRLGAAASAYLHGLQDGQKFMAIMLLCRTLSGNMWAGGRIPITTALLCSGLMAAGTALGGSRIIKKVALDMVSLDPPRGTAADISSSLCLAFATAAGLPVSTTHAKTCAVMGAGSAKRRGGLDMRAVRDMFAAWGLTFPVCFALGYLAARAAGGIR